MLALLVAAPAVLLPSAPAFAQDDAARARSAFDRGTRRFQARRYDEALEAFEEAYAIRTHPAVLFNIASCYDRLERAADAVNAYRRYLRERGDEVEPARRRDVESALARLGGQVASLHVVPPAPGIPVAIDGQALEIGADPVAVDPGEHVVTSTAPDGREARAEVSALLGETAEVTLTFPPPPDESPDTRRGGSGTTNGGTAPAPRTRSGWSPALRWVGIGATVVFAAGWTYTGLRALSMNADFEKNPDPDTRDRGLTYRALADFAFMPATILAAGFTVLAFVLARDDDEAAPARAALRTPVLTPAMTPGGLSLSLTGTF